MVVALVASSRLIYVKLGKFRIGDLLLLAAAVAKVILIDSPS